MVTPTLSHKILTHVIDVEEFRTCASRIKTTIESLNLEQTFEISLEILNMKIQQLEEKIDSLLPHVRNRRGLINGLGTILKSISGNLDDSDGQNILAELSKSQNRTDILIEAQNKQTYLNRDIIIRINNITEHIT